ncbi:hypothetical protein [Mycobacterium sp.]|uniref:hypothetical protein n=1 Tax=Mycobacterium sp. TaxID=1785 RepID=UPI003F985EB1
MTDQAEIPDTDDVTAAAVRFMSTELPKLLAITGTVHAATLEAIAAVLAGGHVFDDLSERDARRVAGNVAFEAIRCGWALDVAAAAVTDRAIAVQLDRASDFDNRMAVGIALHRTARVRKRPKRPLC